MKVFAISDLHLSSVNPKPMDIFGTNWENHWGKIKKDWEEKVSLDDYILIPGDISWALTLNEAMPDILDISGLPGKKIIIKGNHDYWWTSISKVRNAFPPDIIALQNDFADIKEYFICGTRGWMLPDNDRFKDEDMKIYKRELIRLEFSLKNTDLNDNKPIIAMLHYPPFYDNGEPSEFISIMKKYNVKYCIYGHLHGSSLKNVIEGEYEGITFYMVSCDYLNFKLKRIC